MRFENGYKILLLICSPFFCFTQSFDRGKIVLVNGDTLSGYIQNIGYAELCYRVVFKQKIKGEPTSFTPNELRCFEFDDGDYFEAHEMNFDIKRNNGWQHVSGARFLYRLEKGDVDLFELRDGDRQPLFLRKYNGDLQLLNLSKNGEDDYRKIITTIFADCEDLKLPAKLELSLTKIRPIVQAYNKCDEINERKEFPFFQTWAYVGTSLYAVFSDFKGYNRGMSLELRPFKKGFARLWNIGLNGHYSKYKSVRNGSRADNVYIREIALASRFFLPIKNTILSPIGFVSIKKGWYEREEFEFDQISQYNFKSSTWERMRMQVGIGLHGNVKRHIFRFEIPLDEAIEIRLGYGFVLN